MPRVKFREIERAGGARAAATTRNRRVVRLSVVGLAR
jgi:hypothetical protein